MFRPSLVSPNLHMPQKSVVGYLFINMFNNLIAFAQYLHLIRLDNTQTNPAALHAPPAYLTKKHPDHAGVTARITPRTENRSYDMQYRSR